MLKWWATHLAEQLAVYSKNHQSELLMPRFPTMIKKKEGRMLKWWAIHLAEQSE
jgi:hypothetical protein